MFAANKGLSFIIVEGDSAQIVQALTQDDITFSDCSFVLSDCVDLLIYLSFPLVALCMLNDLAIW